MLSFIHTLKLIGNKLMKLRKYAAKNIVRLSNKLLSGNLDLITYQMKAKKELIFFKK